MCIDQTIDQTPIVRPRRLSQVPFLCCQLLDCKVEVGLAGAVNESDGVAYLILGSDLDFQIEINDSFFDLILVALVGPRARVSSARNWPLCGVAGGFSRARIALTRVVISTASMRPS